MRSWVSGNDAGIVVAKSVGAHVGDAATGYDTFIAAMKREGR